MVIYIFSDGVGRTGTYCLIDMVLNRMAKGNCHSVFENVPLTQKKENFMIMFLRHHPHHLALWS